MAWPATAVPSGTDPRTLRWRLHWAADGGLGLDAEAVTGGESAGLAYDPKGLPRSVVERFPHLEGYLALTVDKKTRKRAEEILTGQVAVAQYDSLGRLRDATGVQIPGVLDDLYGDAADSELGVTFSGRAPDVLGLGTHGPGRGRARLAGRRGGR